MGSTAQCPMFEPLERPRLATLEDGFSVSRGYFEERKKALEGISRSPIAEIRAQYNKIRPENTPEPR